MIVLIDDEERLLKEIRENLEFDGFSCISFTNPKDFLDIYKNAEDFKNVDVLVIDYKMPQMLGTELVEIVKKFNVEKPKIVLFSGLANTFDHRTLDVLKQYEVDIVPKPRILELITKIEGYIYAS